MTRLYSDFASLYHHVYPSFIDYDAQFEFYNGMLDKYDCSSVLEIGCGSGRLARRMCAAGRDYQGMDVSADMLQIARTEAPGARFFQGDMRAFTLAEKVDAIIIPARSLSYLLENNDLLAAFSTFYKQLVPGGKLIFDVIDAASLFINMKEDQIIRHIATDGQRHWERESRYEKNLATGWTWNWHSVYYEKKDTGEKTEVARDSATLRAFLAEEVELFLRLSGFRVTEKMTEGSYAFQTFVFVCEIG